ncbi:MAG: hypothetical protein CMH30_03155 [Micavibrio sp.]|nr:hypothetical protein [Micavibrio sp.]
MRSSYKMFSVYIKPGEEASLENAVFVRQGWSWMAGIFKALWFCYHRVWLWTAVFVGMLGILFALDHLGILARAYMDVLSIGIFVFAAANAQDWLAESYEAKGYTLVDVVSGADEMDAQRRFLECYRPNKDVSGFVI